MVHALSGSRLVADGDVAAVALEACFVSPLVMSTHLHFLEFLLNVF